MQMDLNVFQSHPPMAGIVRPRHVTPITQQPQSNYRADRDPVEESLGSEADDRTTLALILKGKAGGIELSSTSAAGVSGCPKGPRTTTGKRKNVSNPE